MNRFLFPWLGYLPMLDADAGSGGSGDAGQGGDSSHSSNSGDAGDGDDGNGKNDGNAGTLTMTQAELDKIIQKRVARAVKDADTKAKADAEKAKLDETERLKLEKKEAEDAANARVTAANARLVKAEASVQAAQLGIKPDRIAAAIKMAALNDVEVGEDGEPDAKAVKKAMEAVISQFPEWKTGSDAASRSGGQFGGNAGNGNADMNALIRRAAGR